jgi:hypothetical protein
MAGMEPGILMQHQHFLCPFFVPLLDFLMKMCEPLRSHQFSNNDALQSSVHESVCAVLKDWFAASIKRLPERWEWCIDLSGEYVDCAEM